MRVDSFIIWSNGVFWLDEIVSVIRDHFDILYIHRHRVKNMKRFVRRVYSTDTYPMRHIKSKIRYLEKKGPGEVMFILVRNNNMDEHLAGKGRFRKVQCRYLQRVKNEIRKMYNPTPEEHVIHGTDYQAQVDHLLKLLRLKPKEYYTREREFPVHYPYHLPDPLAWMEESIPIDSVRAKSIGNGFVPIEELPHYAYVKGDRSQYYNYFYRHVGVSLHEDHFPDKFDQMIKNFNGEYDPIIVNLDGNILLDGAHRLAILKSRGYENVKTISVMI